MRQLRSGWENFHPLVFFLTSQVISSSVRLCCFGRLPNLFQARMCCLNDGRHSSLWNPFFLRGPFSTLHNVLYQIDIWNPFPTSGPPPPPFPPKSDLLSFSFSGGGAIVPSSSRLALRLEEHLHSYPHFTAVPSIEFHPFRCTSARGF